MDGSQNIASPSYFTDHEVHLAIALQQHLLPQPPAQYQGCEIAVHCQPARYLTGDFYDFITLPDSSLGIFIADVAGKSLPASLIMTQTLTLFRFLAPHYQSASALLKELNRRLQPNLSHNLFVTACYSILNVEHHTLTVARAGHETPLHYQQGNVTTLRPSGMALGIDKGERFDNLMAENNVSLQSGDSVIFFTDGLNETLDLNNEEFGMERLKQAIQENAKPVAGAKPLLDGILKTLHDYRGPTLPTDDLTLITLYVA